MMRFGRRWLLVLVFVASSCLPVRAEANRCGEVSAGTIPQAIPLRLWFPMVVGK